MKFTKKICLFAGTVLVGCALICGCKSSKEQIPTTSVTVPTVPVATTVPAVTETVQMPQCTWEEYLAMTEEEALEFQKSFGSIEEFEAWIEQSMSYTIEYPWDIPGGKLPEEYTWEEFEALSSEHQIGFQNVLGMEAFDAWMEQAQSQPEEYPWDAPGAKQPEEYTWEEFEALSPNHQIRFQNVMGSEAFEAWMEQAQNLPVEYPWEASGAKPLEEYTWAEFEALSPEYQIEFQFAMGMEAFEAWMEQVNP